MTERRPASRLKGFEKQALVHLDVLMRAALRILGNHQDAEDVVQDTLMRAWKYFDSFESGSNCRAWLFRIMFNVINVRRGDQARRSESPIETEEGLDQRVNKVVMFDPVRQIEAREILDATDRLSEDHKSVLWLVVVEEFSYSEAADVLDVPIGTVMSRLHRARRELRKLLRVDSGCASQGGLNPA